MERESLSFLKAEKIWLRGLSHDMNIQAGFQCELPQEEGLVLHLTGSTLYRIFWQGELLQYGPARGPHGFCRIDRIPLPFLPGGEAGQGILSIEVAGYNCESYYTLKMPSFLQAEILRNGSVIAATGDGSFQARRLESKHQKVLRYSLQRTFTEVYSLKAQDAETPWYTRLPGNGVETENISLPVRYLEREVSYAPLNRWDHITLHESGRFVLNPGKAIQKSEYPSQITLRSHGIELPGFPEKELSLPAHEIVSSMEYTEKTEKSSVLSAGEYTLYDFNLNNNGFIDLNIRAFECSRVILKFDEKLLGGRIPQECKRVCNFIILDLEACDTAYRFTSFETYGFKFLEVGVLMGSIRINDPGIIEYSTGEYQNCRAVFENEDLQNIFDASLETFRQNTLDIFMDCPTRERAGWLCDSYFTAQAAQYFSGNSDVEKVMLENFILREPDPDLPEHVPAMCYPADHRNKLFIPQWGMWYIAELEGYFQRAPQADPGDFKDLCLNFIRWCEQFENEYGLLEDLPGWNFIEWSRANDWTDGVSYPGNMLYSRILKLTGSWYDRPDYQLKAERIDRYIVENSWNSELFVDNALRDDQGCLVPTDHTSEVCQYSAFAHGVISLEDPVYKALHEKVFHLFGPDRKRRNLHPEIAFANAFIGNYLRAELLLAHGFYARTLEEIKGYFLQMAKITGTLWEYDDIESGSLNHGFASYIGVALLRCLSGIQNLDYRNMSVTIDADLSIHENLEMDMGTPYGPINVSRTFTNDQTRLIIRIPEILSIVYSDKSRLQSNFHEQKDGFYILHFRS